MRVVTVSPGPARVRTAVREVAQPIAYLASPQAASITGADFLIDGGLVKGGLRGGGLERRDPG